MTDTIKFQQEYKTPSNETISIQFDMGKDRWEVACWKDVDSAEECRWYKEFADTATAIKEYERWK